MTRSGPTRRASAQYRPAIQVSGCCSAGTDALAHSTAARRRNPLDKRNGNSPWQGWLRQDWAEEQRRSRPPVAPLRGGRQLVEDSLRGNRAHLRLTTAPKQARTSDPTAPLL